MKLPHFFFFFTVSYLQFFQKWKIKNWTKILPKINLDKFADNFTGAIIIAIALSGYVFAIAVLYAVTVVHVQQAVDAFVRCK